MFNFKKSITDIKSPVKKQILLSYLLKGLGIGISLMYVPLMLSYLSPAQFGLWVTIASIINWLRLFDVGIGNGLRFHLASSLAIGNLNKAKELVSTTYAITGIIFIGVWLLFLVVNPILNWQSLLNSNLISSSEYIKIMMISVTAIVFTLVFDLVKIVYAAHGDTAIGNTLQLISSILSLIGVYILSVFTKKGQLDLAVAVVALSPLFVYFVATVFTFGQKYSSIRPSFDFVKLKHSRDLFNLSAKFFVVQITATIIYASIPFIITTFYGPESVAQYHIANSIFNLPIMVIGLFTAPLTPFVTKEFAKGNLTWVRASLKKALKLSALVSLGTIFLILLSSDIYEFWLGNKIEIPFQLSSLIGIYTIINVITNPLSSFMNAIGKIDTLVWLAPIGIFMFIGGCFLFDFLIGNISAIVLSLGATSLIGLIIEPFVLIKFLKIKIYSNRSTIS